MRFQPELSVLDHPRFPTVARRIAEVCTIAAPRSMLADLHQDFARLNLPAAVARHDTAALFDWLIGVLSYQGVSDAIAWGYMDRHGSVTYGDIAASLVSSPSCPKLRSYWDFAECRFAKQAFTCERPDRIEACPLPRHDLRNGRLNQAAYSLFLFLRDVCDGDLVGWLDARLAAADDQSEYDRVRRMRDAVLEPLSAIYGVSFKVLSMALADLLLAGDPGRERWTTTGGSMIAVDTLVHNWLHRTGSLHALDAAHPHGAACYRPGGCADIIEAASRIIDARQFGPENQAFFPRLVQKAIWLFCTEAGHDFCNGNRIDDRFSCHRTDCPLFMDCCHIPLHDAI